MRTIQAETRDTAPPLDQDLGAAPGSAGGRTLRRPELLTALIATLSVVAAVFASSEIGDYDVLRAAEQNPAPAIQGLADGSLSRFVDLHPVMGSVSLLLRAPVVALSGLLGGDQLLGYRLGALLCFVPALIVGVWLGREIRARGRGRLEAIACAALVVVNPITVDAIRTGHPEEVLGGALALLAVILAARSRPLLAAVALGLAVGTKQWALLAVLPALFAAPRPSRGRIVAVAGVIGVVLAVAAPVADWASYREKAHVLGQTRIVSRYSAWSPVSPQRHVVVAGSDVTVSFRRLPAGLSRENISLLIPMLCAAAVVVAARRRSWRLGESEAVGLLAISFALRVVLDSTVLLYYFAPMVLALAWWEVRRRGLPVGAFAATAFIWAFFHLYDVLPELPSALAFVAGCAAMCVYVARSRTDGHEVGGKKGPRKRARNDESPATREALV